MRSIWFVLDLTSTKRGAICEQLLVVCQRLVEEDVAVTVVFSSPLGLDVSRGFESLGVDVRLLDFRSPRAAMMLLLWFREYRPDIVHFHFLEPRSTFVAAAKMCGATTLVQDHSLPASPTLTEALTHRVRELALGLLADTRLEIHDAVPLARFAGRDGAAVRRELGIGNRPLVVSGLVDEMEGGDTILRALALLDADVHLALVGENGSDVALHVLAGRLGLGKRVHFLGARDDVEEILAAASVVVVAPEGESGPGLAVVEAMAASRPVIVTRVGSLPSILGDAGLVVPGRDPASLGLAIRTVLSDPEQAARMGKTGRKRAEDHYSTDAAVERLLRAYRRIFLRLEPRTAPTKMLQLEI